MVGCAVCCYHGWIVGCGCSGRYPIVFTFSREGEHEDEEMMAATAMPAPISAFAPVPTPPLSGVEVAVEEMLLAAEVLDEAVAVTRMIRCVV